MEDDLCCSYHPFVTGCSRDSSGFIEKFTIIRISSVIRKQWKKKEMLWGLPYVMKDHHLLLSSQKTSDILMNNCIRKEGERRPPERMIQYNKHNIMWDRTNSSQSQSRFIVAILCWICQHELSFWFCSSMNGWVSVQNQGCDFLIWHEQIFFLIPQNVPCDWDLIDIHLWIIQSFNSDNYQFSLNMFLKNCT